MGLDLNQHKPHAGAGYEGRTGQTKNSDTLQNKGGTVKPIVDDALFLVSLVLRIIESIFIPRRFNPRISLWMDIFQQKKDQCHDKY